jgi:hypothetical protein
MGILIGPTPWWQSLVVSTAPVGSTLPDGSRLICKAGGTAWIVAPASTQVAQTWNNSTSTQVGNKCCACDWPTLNTRLINCGFNPADWFVPSMGQFLNPGYLCRTNWDTYVNNRYWTSTESNATSACESFLGGIANINVKTESQQVRAFRCVTY